MGSGDFYNQAPKPKPLRLDVLMRKAGAGAAEGLELMGSPPWREIPTQLAKDAIDIFFHDLIVLGHRNTTVGELATRMGITYKDGSWQ